MKKSINNQRLTLEKLCEMLPGCSIWEKNGMRRAYIRRGHQTGKMSTKAWIEESGDEFVIACFVECPSQTLAWIKSQEERVIDSVIRDIQEDVDGDGDEDSTHNN